MYNLRVDMHQNSYYKHLACCEVLPLITITANNELKNKYALR